MKVQVSLEIVVNIETRASTEAKAIKEAQEAFPDALRQILEGEPLDDDYELLVHQAFADVLKATPQLRLVQ